MKFNGTVNVALPSIGGERQRGFARCPVDSPIPGVRALSVMESTPDDVVRAAEVAHAAQQSWGGCHPRHRAEQVSALADRIAENAEILAQQIVLDTGKTIRDSRIEVTRSITTLRISAEEGTRIAGNGYPTEANAPSMSWSVRVPVGVVAAITPFNAPLGTLCHKLGPALVAGNAIIVKPHHQGAGVTSLVSDLMEGLDLPIGTYNTVHGETAVGTALTQAPRVDFINFTGSGGVAREILKAAGLKRTLFELGGVGPTFVHADADLDRAVAGILPASFGLAGQSCIATQVVLVHDDVHDGLVKRLLDDVQSLNVGDPREDDTDVGPMNSVASANRVADLVKASQSIGGRLLCGGQKEGAFHAPTIITDVDYAMPVMSTEAFGPILAVKGYKDLTETVAWVNSLPWGLKCGIYTSNLEVAFRAMSELNFGTVNVNAPSRSRSDAEPSGGVKESGWGHEGPRYAIQAMTYERVLNVQV